MTLTTNPDTGSATLTAERLRPVSFDLYRDIHKGIRSELFALVNEAGRLDPADDCGVVALCDQVERTVRLLLDHAEHEDGAIQPVLEVHARRLAAQVAHEHRSVDALMDRLVSLAAEARGANPRRALLHELYLDLAGFTSIYLAHQDLEEREVAQALDSVVGLDGMLAIHGAILGNMAPQQLVSGLAVMFPAMNVDDRTDLLGGMKATAPTEAFQGVWSLAQSVLTTDEHRAVADRLGLS